MICLPICLLSVSGSYPFFLLSRSTPEKKGLILDDPRTRGPTWVFCKKQKVPRSSCTSCPVRLIESLLGRGRMGVRASVLLCWPGPWRTRGAGTETNARNRAVERCER